MDLRESTEFQDSQGYIETSYLKTRKLFPSTLAFFWVTSVMEMKSRAVETERERFQKGSEFVQITQCLACQSPRN